MHHKENRMNKLFNKVKEDDYFIYGFTRKSSDFLVDEWSEYSIKNMLEIAKYTDNTISSYDSVNYFAYMTLVSLFFNPTKNNYLIYQDYFEENKDEHSIDSRLALNLQFETIETKFKTFSLNKSDFKVYDHLYVKKVTDPKNLFSYDIMGITGSESQGVTFVVANKITSENFLSDLLDAEADISVILDDIYYLVVLEVTHDMGYISGFNIYSKNDLEKDIMKIEQKFISRMEKFNHKMITIKTSKEFINALETFVIGKDKIESFIWQ